MKNQKLINFLIKHNQDSIDNFLLSELKKVMSEFLYRPRNNYTLETIKMAFEKLNKTEVHQELIDLGYEFNFEIDDSFTFKIKLNDNMLVTGEFK